MRTAKTLIPAAATGLLAGLVAALAMTALMLVLRTVAGIPTPSELVGDRFAPLIPARDFGGLISWAGGYNELKQLGVFAVLVGQIAAGVLGGAVYAVLRDRGSRARGFLVGFVIFLWLAALIVLWPVLPTNFAGLPPDPARVVTAASMLAAFALYGVLTAGLVKTLRPAREKPAGDASTGAASHLGRRAILVGAAGVGLLAVSGGLLRRLSDDATFAYDGLQVRGPDIEPITPNELFYVVSKNVIDPAVDGGLWRMAVTGQVDRPSTIDLAALRAMPAVEQETTLMCISNIVSGGLMSNAIWRGVPLASLIDQAGPRSGAVEVVCKSVDGYSDTFAIDKAMEPTTLVAYEMNGEPLPRRHGYPVRLIVPGLFGEKSIKWLTEVELVDRDVLGFYETQGWGPGFVIPTRSRFYGPDLRQPISVGQPVRLNGTAFGGDRGVAAVEVSVDDGSTWQPAQLDYPGSRLSWALWSFEWTPTAAGESRLGVRATDRQGNVQTGASRPVVPEGATGIHVVRATVQA
ncbi:MAG: molybdopterin-dependent oxidoreductase [Chloroflexi bacterium]|nr:molybdopterin-dependent oxidoreductase [Chloroflexota bacterium]